MGKNERGRAPPDADVGELFLAEQRRRVQKDRTVTLDGVAFEVDAALVGEHVTLRRGLASGPTRRARKARRRARKLLRQAQLHHESPAVSKNGHELRGALKGEPYPATSLASVFATRIGRGGEPGKPRPSGVTKFVIEFAGGALDTLAKGTLPKPNISASRGTISYVFVEPIPSTRPLSGAVRRHARRP